MQYKRHLVGLILLLVLCMTACKSQSIDSQLVGSWYIDEEDAASFVLYSDGTCEIAGEYGRGKWSVVNENILKLTNYYGQVETASIKSIENGILILGEGNNTNTFRSNPNTDNGEVTKERDDGSNVTETNKDADSTIRVEDISDEIDSFAGPGEDYYAYGTVKKADIKKVLKIEGQWAEVQLLKQRVYVKKDAISELCTNEIPRVVYKLSFDQNVKQYPTVYYYDAEIILFDDVKLYKDVKGNSIGEINAGEKVTVLCKEKSGIATYDQIETIIDGEKYRYYTNHMDLFSLDNPLLNFEKVKETNAVLSYKGENYYSTSGENTQLPRGWKEKEEFTISKSEFDIMAGITSVIAGGDVNDEAMDAAAGLINIEEREFINSNVKSKTGSNLVTFVDFFFNGTLNFLQGAKKTTVLQIQLKECSGEQKIVIKTGAPMESVYAGKTMSLEELIVNHNNTAATMINASQRADEIIKSIYPNYDKNKKYHMQITFAKKTDGYGYYIVIDKDYKVYAVPIVHEGTSMAIYSGGQLVYDVASDLASCMIQLDEESAQKILQLLGENGITIQGWNSGEDSEIEQVSYYGGWSNYDEAESMAERLEITFESDEMIGEVSATIAGREYATGTYFIQEDGSFSCTLIIDAIYNNANAQWEPAYDVVYLNGEHLKENSIECELQYEGAKTISSYYLERINIPY